MSEIAKPLEERIAESKAAVDLIDQEFLRVHAEKGYSSETKDIEQRGLKAIADFILDNPDADSFAKEAVMYRGDNRERFLRFRGDNNDSEHSRDLMWHAIIEKIVEISNARLKASEKPQQPEVDPASTAITETVQTSAAKALKKTTLQYSEVGKIYVVREDFDYLQIAYVPDDNGEPMSPPDDKRFINLQTGDKVEIKASPIFNKVILVINDTQTVWLEQDKLRDIKVTE